MPSRQRLSASAAAAAAGPPRRRTTKFNSSTTSKYSYGPSTGIDPELLEKRRRQALGEEAADDDGDDGDSSNDGSVDDGDHRGPRANNNNSALASYISSKYQNNDEDDDGDDQSGKNKKSSVLTDEDRTRAMRLLAEDEQDEKNRVKRKETEWRSTKRQIRQSKPLLGTLSQSEVVREAESQLGQGTLRKYRRERHDVEKFHQGLFQVKNERTNRKENTYRALWSDQDRMLAEVNLARTEILRQVKVPAGIDIERGDVVAHTNQITQERLVDEVDMVSKTKVFDIELKQHGPYLIRYNQSGRHALLGGTKGHLAAVQWRKFDMMHENHVSSRIADVVWMMDDSMYASAERPFTNVYDKDGAEIHTVREFASVQHLEYLPYHFLLVGASEHTLSYLDITMGMLPAQIKMQSPVTCMAQNPHNAVIALGHSNGTVSMCTPRDSDYKPVVSMLCHGAPVQNVRVDHSGTFMVTTARDNTVKVWDIRTTYEPLATTTSPANVSSMSISQSGMLAMSCSNQVFVWKHCTQVDKKVYMKHKVPASMIQSLDFCPFEDVLGIGHARGVSSILIPGSGVQSYDSRLPNPYFKEKDSADYNVRALLEKIPHDMIALDPSAVGTTGTRLRDYKFSKGVEMTDELRDQLKTVGVVDASGRGLDKRKTTTRDEQRAELLKRHEDRKAERAEHWFEDKDADAVDRFATWKRKKNLEDGEEDLFASDDDEEDDSDEEEEDNDRDAKRRRVADEEDDDDDDEESDALFSTDKFASRSNKFHSGDLELSTGALSRFDDNDDSGDGDSDESEDDDR